MSQASKFSLAAASLLAVGVIAFVHSQQKAEKVQQRIKRERQLDFDMQRALEQEYKREQSVHSSLEPANKASGPPR
ncbi:hypothetical protein Trco_004732 [Trichoderma cornu-damae]|uniref:Cytochrome c oxidase assembly protein n=1 Tax=Trichoderma cornu-damae TaxID=654480 RepID=A0A9P8QI67_9HYPO|nr:hypothetical protein Trco_004732 [Trichoderma cornu-damae]